MARDDDVITPDDNDSDELVPAWTPDGHLDEGTIHTWLDGAFDEAQSAIVTAHVDGCTRCSESVAEARGFIAGASRMVRALDAVPSDVVAPADVERVASRIVAAAVAEVSRTTTAQAKARRAWYTQPVMRAAAAMLVIVGGGTYVWSRTSPVPAIESRVAVEQSVAPAVAPSEAPKPDAASERIARIAPPARAKPQPVAKEARADNPSSNLAVAARDSTRVLATQAIEDRSRAAGAVASERRAFAVDASAPASPPPTPPRAMGNSGARVVSGRVTTPSGAPAAGILVTVAGRQSSVATTDSAGAFRLQVVGDSVTLVARQIGYAPTTQAVDLRSRDSARVNLKIERSVQLLTSLPIINPSVPTKVLEVPASIAGTSGVPIVMGGIVQSNVVSRGVATRRCWSVRVNGTSVLRLPSHVLGPSLADTGAISTQWINWPFKGRFTDVEMERVGKGALTGSGVLGQDTVVLTLTPRGNDWTGLAVHRDSVSRLEQPLELRRASDGMCKM